MKTWNQKARYYGLLNQSHIQGAGVSMDWGHIPHSIKKVMTKNQQKKTLELKLLDKWRNQIREVGLELENE